MVNVGLLTDLPLAERPTPWPLTVLGRIPYPAPCLLGAGKESLNQASQCCAQHPRPHGSPAHPRGDLAAWSQHGNKFPALCGCQSLCCALFIGINGKRMVIPVGLDALQGSQPSPDTAHGCSWEPPGDQQSSVWSSVPRPHQEAASPARSSSLSLVSPQCCGYKKKKKHISNSSSCTLWAFTSKALIGTARKWALRQADEKRGDCNEIPFVILVKAQNQRASVNQWSLSCSLS